MNGYLKNFKKQRYYTKEHKKSYNYSDVQKNISIDKISI